MNEIYKFKNMLSQVNDLNKIINDQEHYSDTQYLIKLYIQKRLNLRNEINSKQVRHILDKYYHKLNLRLLHNDACMNNLLVIEYISKFREIGDISELKNDNLCEMYIDCLNRLKEWFLVKLYIIEEENKSNEKPELKPEIIYSIINEFFSYNSNSFLKVSEVIKEIKKDTFINYYYELNIFPQLTKDSVAEIINKIEL